jgi:hypothetical protein
MNRTRKSGDYSQVRGRHHEGLAHADAWYARLLPEGAYLGTCCVRTEIHHPTDSGQLVDSVVMLSRFVQRAKGLA